MNLFLNDEELFTNRRTQFRRLPKRYKQYHHHALKQMSNRNKYVVGSRMYVSYSSVKCSTRMCVYPPFVQACTARSNVRTTHQGQTYRHGWVLLPEEREGEKRDFPKINCCSLSLNVPPPRPHTHPSHRCPRSILRPFFLIFVIVIAAQSVGYILQVRYRARSWDKKK